MYWIHTRYFLLFLPVNFVCFNQYAVFKLGDAIMWKSFVCYKFGFQWSSRCLTECALQYILQVIKLPARTRVSLVRKLYRNGSSSWRSHSHSQLFIFGSRQVFEFFVVPKILPVENQNLVPLKFWIQYWKTYKMPSPSFFFLHISIEYNVYACLILLIFHFIFSNIHF